jgi:hypothetical protein
VPSSQLKWRAHVADGTRYGGGMKVQLRKTTETNESNAPTLTALLLNETDQQACSPNPILQVNISDASSLRFVGPKGELAYLSINDTLKIPLSQVFTPAVNSSNKGSVTYPFDSLKPGKYKIQVSCFDVHTNQGNLTFEFTVAAAKENRTLRIYPNPMTERSNFSFLQEKRWTSYAYKLKIYSNLGKQIVERSGIIPGSDDANLTFSIDWSNEEKAQFDFINYYQLELTYGTGAPFASFSGRIGHIK